MFGANFELCFSLNCPCLVFAVVGVLSVILVFDPLRRVFFFCKRLLPAMCQFWLIAADHVKCFHATGQSFSGFAAFCPCIKFLTSTLITSILVLYFQVFICSFCQVIFATVVHKIISPYLVPFLRVSSELSA